MFGNEIIDHIAIGCMYIDQTAMFSYFFHQADHLPVIDHQCTFIGHKGFKRSDAFFFYNVLYFFFVYYH